MGHYRRGGKQVLFQQINENGNSEEIHIADAGDNEKADFLAQAANSFRVVGHYIGDARATLSPSWHGEKVARKQFVGRINGAIDAINKLDALKKTLFYGRDNNLIAEGQRDVSDLPASIDSGNSDAANIIHAILGKVTEAGELLELLRNAYNGHGFDRINAIEEVGDGFWYDAILLHEADSSFEDAMRRNINKLRARFPEAFQADYANHRDLAAERAILEDEANPLVEEANSVEPDMVDAPVTKGNLGGGELHLSPAARKHPLPGEHLAHQRIRREDS